MNGQPDEIISGKGQALVCLLSGAPGLGKTLTAECIAEELQVPLHSITSGELGTDVARIDVTLRKLLSRARSWNAILLLDEADVFLAECQTADLKRNTLVSVFLRSIEYYQGILFLATNRSKDFDKAFQSRIHLKIHYEHLDVRHRENIWRNLHGNSKGCKMWAGEVYKALARVYDINGREMKNTFNTAIAVAEFVGSVLSKQHVRTVYELSQMRKNGSDADRD